MARRVVMRCKKCGERAQEEPVGRDEKSKTGYRYPWRCTGNAHQPEGTDPNENGAYTESIEALIDAVAEGNDATKELVHASEMAVKVKSPFEISVR